MNPGGMHQISMRDAVTILLFGFNVLFSGKSTKNVNTSRETY